MVNKTERTLTTTGGSRAFSKTLEEFGDEHPQGVEVVLQGRHGFLRLTQQPPRNSIRLAKGRE